MELEDQEKEIQLCKEPIIYGGGGAVDSVNGYTGDVILTTSDLENTSDYQNSTEVQALIDSSIINKQDKLTAGDNITIENNVISAADTTYIAGTGIEITSENVINATGSSTTAWGDITGTLSDQTDLVNALNDKQDVLTAGDGITIDSNVISADIVPADYFTASETVTGTSSVLSLTDTIEAKVKDIQLYGDTTQQTYSGKNLLPILDGTITYAGITATMENGILTIDGTASDGLCIKLTNGFDKINTSNINTDWLNETITNDLSDKVLSIKLVGGTAPGSGAAFRIYNDTTTFIKQAYPNITQDITFSAGDAASCFILFTNAGKTFDNAKYEIQLETGSESSSYEPYVGGKASPNPSFPQNVNVATGEQIVTIMGKNLFNPNTTTINKRLDGAGLLITDNSYLTSDYIKVKSSADYTYSRYETGGGSAAVCFFKADKTFISRTTWFGGPNQAKTNFNFTTSEDTGYVRICDLKTLTTLQVESGNISSLYEPYQSQSYTVNLGSIELCKIGTYQDYIYKSSDDWYVHKEFGKVVLDGTEDWGTGNNIPYCLSILDYAISGNIPVSDYFQGVANVSDVNSVPANSMAFINVSGSTTPRFYVNYPDYFTSASQIKTWLSTHNTTVYYAIATPTDTKITDTSLITQLDALYNAKSYDEQTNFAVTSTNLPALLYAVVYRKSLDGTLGAINSIVDTNTTYTAGTNVQISSDNVISATDTTYSNFTGTDGVTAGTSGLVPAPATTDAGKFLKADGTWDTVGGGGDIVYSTVTTSNAANGGAVYIGDKDANQAIQSDPTSTDNHYKYFWALPNSTSNMPWNNTVNIMGGTSNYGSGSVSILGLGATQDSVEIGNQAYAEGVNSVAIGKSSDSKTNGVAIGEQANGRNYSVSIGSSAGLYSAGNMVSCVNIGNQAGLSSQSGNNFSVNLGANSRGTRKGEVNVGLVTGNTTSGYNDSAYRVIGGVYDGQLDHDVVTVGQLNGRILQNAGAPTTATVGTVGQLLEDTTNGKLYQCTAIDTTDPNNPSYTWSEVGTGGGGGPTVVQTTGTSQTDVMSQDAITKSIYPRFGVYNDAIGIVGANESQDSSAGAMSVGVGSGHKARGDNSVAIGAGTTIYAAGLYSTAIGSTAKTEGHSRAVAIGNAANAAFDNSVAIGTNAKTTRIGEVNVGADTSGRGYNSTNYRVVGGVHDGQLAQDAVTVNQVNSLIDNLNSALNINIPHIGA